MRKQYDIDVSTNYLDKGCALYPSCIECPFTICVEDYPGGKKAWLIRERDNEIQRLFVQDKSIEQLALLFNVSSRTIRRVIAK